MALKKKFQNYAKFQHQESVFNDATKSDIVEAREKAIVSSYG